MDRYMAPLTDGDCVWLNWPEIMKLSRRLTVDQMGRVIQEICEAHQDGILTNGPLVRVDPPANWEASNG